MKSLYGLPSKVVHCKFCLMSNQKPFSINETKNKKGSHKNGLYINKKENVQHAFIMKKRT